MLEIIASFIDDPKTFTLTPGENDFFGRVSSVLACVSAAVEADWDTSKMQEDTFCVNAFDIFSGNFIRTISGTSFHGRDHQIIESKERKVKLSKSLGINSPVRGRKPDRSISISVNNCTHHIVLCEIKTESASKEKKGDLVKLGSMMKDCLDAILSRNVDRQLFYVVGILQEGQKSTLFVMNSPFNFIYQLIEVVSCRLPSNIGI